MLYYIRLFRTMPLLIHLTADNNQYNSLLSCFEFILIVLTFATVFNGVESSHNYSFSESIYFTLATLSTVGYGDIHPTTLLGRICSIIMIIFLFLWLPEKVSIIIEYEERYPFFKNIKKARFYQHFFNLKKII